MRALRLATASLEAERVRLGLFSRRLAVRLAFAIVAVLFLCGAFAMLHVLAWLALERHVGPIGRAGLLLGADLLIALAFLAIAARDRPTTPEIEARILRDTALTQARASFGLLPLLGGVASSPLLGILFGFLRRRR
ncbi:hypothetical protein [Roseomonas sp. 18066]|uniref:hypothetical protein n=1 Tax=Roseomonas sp. 18066 TaxID=2681412 RepID=UPI00135AB4A9|nr:hypothetical protein [Roseomonas sp. 18066]